MKCFSKNTLFLLFSSILLFNACVRDNDVNKNQSAANSDQIGVSNNNANIAKDDVIELSTLINSPFEFDESSVWREINLTPQNKDPESSNKKLIAVLKFTPEDAAEIIKRAEKYKPSVPAELDAESWFPPELIAQSDASGNETIKGNSYAANDFVKTPYTGGKLTRIVNTDYFILELTTF